MIGHFHDIGLNWIFVGRLLHPKVAAARFHPKPRTILFAAPVLSIVSLASENRRQAC
jgi:hypothetical protein